MPRLRENRRVNTEAGWTGSDAVVLAAVANSGRHDLVSVIAAGDACNHDDPPVDVWRAGIGRLHESGLLEPPTTLRLRLSRPGRRLARRRQGGLIEQVGSLRRLLDEVEMIDGRWGLEEADYDLAVRTYLRR